MGAADALAGVASHPAAALVSARRLVEHHPTNAPLWSICAHGVTSMDPWRDIDRIARDISLDETAGHLVDSLADAQSIVMVGWSGHLVDALVRRGDVHALVVDSLGDGQDALRYLSRHDVSCELVAPEGLAFAAINADVTILSAMAVGDNSVLCAGGALALASVAYCSEKPVWMLAPVGTRLPTVLFDHMVNEQCDRPDPWASGVDIVPHAFVSAVFSNEHTKALPGTLAAMKACPEAPELLRRSVV